MTRTLINLKAKAAQKLRAERKRLHEHNLRLQMRAKIRRRLRKQAELRREQDAATTFHTQSYQY